MTKPSRGCDELLSSITLWRCIPWREAYLKGDGVSTDASRGLQLLQHGLDGPSGEQLKALCLERVEDGDTAMPVRWTFYRVQPLTHPDPFGLQPPAVNTLRRRWQSRASAADRSRCVWTARQCHGHRDRRQLPAASKMKVRA